MLRYTDSKDGGEAVVEEFGEENVTICQALTNPPLSSIELGEKQSHQKRQRSEDNLAELWIRLSWVSMDRLQSCKSMSSWTQ